ncbi:crotonobetainyl-CoA:carnitine CoA-transferase CaiB-like acyl-CoA transferase [Streptomyces sp. 2333.5]|uniref:CaiB/BaiF CoA transferase family protein n=1 Tax=unclassified Streptomyces TaxID=2593676 RepID=UPI00089A6A2A|nr:MULTISPECIES: CoA transferase [unclassified Streptomyces]PJJ02543.1 crotonobetainyl-CoA:carnitine CoA-transferase CaiB-like acyl-CoA transferase [Streptomyces sp. 2333.5]SED14948.1 Crotonobetainyl-CoA:carnitine CoA-transferase CaiB [Streptomyces sp. 2314.4]SEE02473.1 Crotonobetainyl-CoA:carnitine CoA-transferase CaiB [Streptomyces sp. 2112.2]
MPQPPRPPADAAPQPPAGGPPARALDGILVADFSRVLAGPLAAATLADLGAEVIKVERPGTGDDTRAWGPPFVPDPEDPTREPGGDGTGQRGTAAYFDAANRSKRGLALDLGDPDDAAAARELARRADVLIENFRPGSLARYGLDHTATRAANPGLVHCTITGFGAGPGARLPGYDFVVQAVGGLMSITGEPGGTPLKAGVALVDVLTAKDATTGILAALRHRDRTGEGQLVEVNLLSSLLGSLVNQASGHLATGRDPEPMGNRHPSIAPYETLACRDGELLAVAAGNDRQFRALTQTLGAPELADDIRFVRNRDRVQNRTDLIKALEDLLSADTPQAWAERLTAASVACGPVNTVSEALALAARLGLDPVIPVGEGRIPQVASPLRLSGTPVTQPSAPPRLDENGPALRTWLSGPADHPLPPRA